MLSRSSAGSSARFSTWCSSCWVRRGASGFSGPSEAAGSTTFCAERIVTALIFAIALYMVTMDADVIVVGAGLAGLAATAELADAGRKVLLLDQEPEQSLGGEAFLSFGGLFFVDSPQQRRLRLKDSRDLAWQGWLRDPRLRPA